MNETILREFGKGIQKLIDKKDLSADETYEMFRAVLKGEQPDLHQGAFLAALVAKRETAEEIVGAWRAIQELDTVEAPEPLPEQLCENSGTGMDSLKTFNVSSAAAVIAASCGAKMARHGARALTSFCGTVDIMESVGVDVNCPVETVSRSIRNTGIGLFNGMSPAVHPGALGRILSQIRFGSTLNIAASLANPARPTHAVRGVYSEGLLATVAELMPQIGYASGMVVHGRARDLEGGMDEISVSGPTIVHEFSANNPSSVYEINPEDHGIACAPFSSVAATGNAVSERKRFLLVLSGREGGACEDFACINAAAILKVAGIAPSLQDGLLLSRQSIATGAAMDKLRDWVQTQSGAGHKGIDTLDRAVEEISNN